MSDLTTEPRKTPGAPPDKNFIAALVTGLIALCVLAGSVQACDARTEDTMKTVIIECLKAGRDPILCREILR